jgi:hypothetical protein
MALPWFRYYSADLELNQVIELDDVQFRVWILLQSIASQEDPRGRLPDTRQVSRRLAAMGVRVRRELVNEGRTAQLLTFFREEGFLVEDAETGRLMPFNWDRQKPSDDAATRMASLRHVKRRSEPVPNISRTRGELVPNNRRTSSVSVTRFPLSSSSLSLRSDQETDLPELLSTELTEEEEEGCSEHVQNSLKAAGIALPLLDEIDAALLASGAECVLHCIEVALRNNKPSWAYVEATRRAHEESGCPEDIRQTRRERLIAGRQG